MPQMRLVLDPERSGLGIDPRKLIASDPNAEIIVTGLPDGMQSGRPSMMIVVPLASGEYVAAETSWTLFEQAYLAFKGLFGPAEHDGSIIETDEGHAIKFVKSEEPFVKCGHCDWELHGTNTQESVQHLVRQYERHYRKRHRGIQPPPLHPDFN